MKYKVNEAKNFLDSDWNTHYVCLFKDPGWRGEGNFCGWYGAEYYENTTMLAYAKNHKSGGAVYNPYQREEKVVVCNRKYESIMIFSCMAEITFECDSDKEAIQRFINKDY